MMSDSVRVEKITIADEETLNRLVALRCKLLDIAEEEFDFLSEDNNCPQVVDGVICSMFLNVAVSIQIGSKFGDVMTAQQRVEEGNLLVLSICKLIAERLRELECKDE